VDQTGTHQDARLIAAAIAAALRRSRASAKRAKKTREQRKAAQEAHQGDFDYLLGDWEYTAVRRMPAGPQKLHGYWSALRLADGQILDENRVVGDEGETQYLTTTLRNYNSFEDRWELVGANEGSGLLDFGTARREEDETQIEQTFGAASGEPTLWRSAATASRPTASPGPPNAPWTAATPGSRTSRRSRRTGSARPARCRR
jgi:hypothetical protein